MLETTESKIFTNPLIEKTGQNAKRIIQEIEQQSDDYFKNSSEDEFAEYLISKYEIINSLEIHWAETQIEIDQVEIFGRDLPATFDVSNPNLKFIKKQIKYLIPYTGDGDILFFKPSNTIYASYMGGKPYRTIDNLIFSYIDLYDNSENIDREFESSKNEFVRRYSHLQEEIERYNKELPGFIKNEIKKKLQRIKNLDDYKSKFKFPIKSDKNTPESFKIEKVVKRTKIVPKPKVLQNGKESEERYITEEDYHRILSILQDCGRNWESHPDTYKGKNEETLRSQLIYVLAPNINGVVAGEAYNKKGKTDIAIKHNSTNLFIGECKIWKGQKRFSETIDQILGYLTWRDSKAAILVFVPNKDISNVLDETIEAVKKHPNYVRTMDKINQGWSNYRFHLENDKSSYLTIAVQLYHLPEL